MRSKAVICSRGLWLRQVVSTAFFFLPFLSSPLWAIPSPDLVVNFVASAAQILGLLTVVAGSVAYSGRQRGKAGGKTSSSWKWPFRVCLAALLVSIAANVFQYSRAKDERNQRLQTNLWRSSTEAGKKVGDVNLKTLSVSEQMKRPEACRTEDLVAWFAEGKPMNLIDVREPEEVEMGMIPGAWHRRYPDLFKNRTGIVVEGKETILLCESGNRSGELCGDFLKEGIPCRFMIGGYEKWVAEDRPLQDRKERTSGEIRDIADYPNKLKLLDTPEVMELLAREKVLFVDVRYPGDFDLGHIPEALCLPLRKMTSDELWPALKALPKRPIVAPCYDKRSSFYGMILGLRLHRLGYDFRGRYTVPHEFAKPADDKAWVSQWKEAQAGKTLLGTVSGPLGGALGWLRERTGSLAVAIVILVLALRLLVLPLTCKAERDQILQKRLEPEIKALKAKLGGDPRRLSRAILDLYRRERLTLGRNLVGTIAQVLLFIVFFSVVNAAAADSNQGLWWLPSLGIPDPHYILPAAVGALIFGYLFSNAPRRTRGRVAIHILCGALLFFLTFQLRAAVNVYLACNLTLLFIQSRATSAFLARLERRQTTTGPVETLEDSGVVLLRLAHMVPGTGNKAIRLGRMMEKGIPVPDGFVVTDKVLSRGNGGLVLSSSEKKRISQAWRGLHTRHVAVRSSGLNEDGAQKSYAGVFESLLNVPWDKLVHAVEEVQASLRSSRVEAYSGLSNERGGILIQKMVAAEYAGVLFTEHPASTGCILVELVQGLGDALVSGAATPRSFRYGRLSGQLLDEDAPPTDLAPLLELGRKVEEAFGRPQDIEWAYSEGSFYILQARDITTSSRNGDEPRNILEAERHRLVGIVQASQDALEASGVKAVTGKNTVVFAQNELSELLPRPTPLSLSFMEALWAPGGSTDLACRSLGIPYEVGENAPPYVNSVFGALYVNRLEEKRRTRRGPGAVACFKLARGALALEQELRAIVPELQREARLRDAVDPSRLTTHELLSLSKEWTERFLTETYVGAERINLAADFYLKAAKREIEKRGLDPSSYLAHLPETVVHRAMAILPGIESGERTVEEFLEVFGHRSPTDYELAQARYRENPGLVLDMASRAKVSSPSLEQLTPPEGASDRMFVLAVERARRFQVLKEEAKHASLRELACVRTLLVELGSRLGFDDGIFYLTLHEVSQLGDEDFLDSAITLVERRRLEAEAFRTVELPTELTLGQLEAISTEATGTGGTVHVSATHSGELRGTRVAGMKEVVGRVRVVTQPSDIQSFQKGEVLVARFTDPTWTPLFPLAGGVVTEVGGWLSHAAIVAREYNVTCIVGVAGAMAALKTGDFVCLSADGTVKKTEAERRRHRRVPASARVALLKQGEIIEAILRNLSRTGALVDVEEELEAGQGLSFKISTDGEEVCARVVRRDESGGYALHFATPLAGPLPQDEGPGRN